MLSVLSNVKVDKNPIKRLINIDAEKVADMELLNLLINKTLFENVRYSQTNLLQTDTNTHRILMRN